MLKNTVLDVKQSRIFMQCEYYRKLKYQNQELNSSLHDCFPHVILNNSEFSHGTMASPVAVVDKRKSISSRTTAGRSFHCSLTSAGDVRWHFIPHRDPTEAKSGGGVILNVFCGSFTKVPRVARANKNSGARFGYGGPPGRLIRVNVRSFSR